jgi:hypothetical protein
MSIYGAARVAEYCITASLRVQVNHTIELGPSALDQCCSAMQYYYYIRQHYIIRHVKRTIKPDTCRYQLDVYVAHFYKEFGPDGVRKSGQAVFHITVWP